MHLWTVLVLVIVLSASIIGIGRKWQIKPIHYQVWLLAMLAIAAATLTGITRVWPTVEPWLAVGASIAICYGLTLAMILYFFFRNPDRQVQLDERQLVSPADGTIVYIKQIEEARFPFAVKGRKTIPLSEFVDADFVTERCTQIGIAMNFLNVHVNRSPINGTVKLVKRIPGKFMSLRQIASLLENERTLMVVENDHIALGIVLIASRLVRRIVSYVTTGEVIEQGQRIGAIRFGSQVDLLIPEVPGMEIIAKVGDEVMAGESVLVLLPAELQQIQAIDSNEIGCIAAGL